MKLINRETIKGKASAKSMTLASVVLTGAIALTATGCDAQIKADGITIDSLTITGSDADGILEGADITINGKNVDLTDIAIPTQAVKQADPSDNGNPVAAPSDNKASENNEAGTKTPADTSDDSQVVTPSDNTNADTKADDTASDIGVQIISIADKYSALREARVYRRPLTRIESLLILYREVREGKILPDVYKALVKYAEKYDN